MAFELLGQQEQPKGDQVYVIKVYIDRDTNTHRHEYVLNGEILYYMEYERMLPEEPADETEIVAPFVDGFNAWFDMFGPDWRPEAFYLE